MSSASGRGESLSTLLSRVVDSRRRRRVACRADTTDERYAWLNGIVAIGVGWFTREGVAYTIYEIK